MVTGLAAGSYNVQFYGGARLRELRNYVTQWYDNESSQASASPVSVTVGSTTPSINAAMQPGGHNHRHGDRAAVGGAALGGICVSAS